MKKATLLSIAAAALLLGVWLAPQATHADILIPTKTTVYFDNADGTEHFKPVDYTLTCYGYDWLPTTETVTKEEGSYNPEKVYSYSAYCPHYGCTIYEDYYLNYRHIDFCKIDGETGGMEFTIENVGGRPVDFDTCKDVKNGEEENDKGYAIMRACEVHFTLPEQMSEKEDRGFFMALWCWILELFGANCNG